MNPISSGRGLSFLASPSFAQSFSLLHKLSQPWLQTGQVEGARVEHLHHFGIDLRRLSPESQPLIRRKTSTAAKAIRCCYRRMDG